MKVRVILFFLLLFGIAGYFRERFFEHLNIIMVGRYRGTDEYPVGMKAPAIMEPFNSWSYEALYYSKYLFTLIWIALFFCISYFALKKLASNKNILKFLTYSYLILLLLAGISMVYGYIVNKRLGDDEYTFSRWLLGIAQSPLVCLILLASEKLYNRSFQSK